MAKTSAVVSIEFQASDQFQRFEYVDEKSSKFWEIRVSGDDTEVRFGKIGTTGQAQTKSFDSPGAAQKSADKLIAEKIKSGYQGFVSTEVPAKPEPATAQPLPSVNVKTVAIKDSVNPNVPQVTARQTDKSAGTMKTICISGKLNSGLRKADYESALQNINFKLVDDVVAGLSLLVLADPTSTSAKAEKARKLGVQVISEDQLIALTSGKLSGD